MYLFFFLGCLDIFTGNEKHWFDWETDSVCSDGRIDDAMQVGSSVGFETTINTAQEQTNIDKPVLCVI